MLLLNRLLLPILSIQRGIVTFCHPFPSKPRILSDKRTLRRPNLAFQGHPVGARRRHAGCYYQSVLRSCATSAPHPSCGLSSPRYTASRSRSPESWISNNFLRWPSYLLPILLRRREPVVARRSLEICRCSSPTPKSTPLSHTPPRERLQHPERPSEPFHS